MWWQIRIFDRPLFHSRWLSVLCIGLGILGILLPSTAVAQPNPIVVENALPGNPPIEWDVSGAGDASIQGFGTDISVDQGQTIDFKIKTDATDYRLDIYRLGYYNGDGARFIATVQPSATLPQAQPACDWDGSVQLLDCGTWAVSASWSVPADATSGIYLAKLVREDPEDGRASHIAFIVRDDDGGSDLLFQTSDTTWQAYNRYGEGDLIGGNSLYTGPGSKAEKISYNRPFTTRLAPTEDWVFNAEYPMVRWLERNGYDVSYFTNIDTDRYGAEILEHQVFLSVGHDEYWSQAMRTNVELARDAGVHLGFFSGNEVYWKIRWENSIDGNNTPYRTLVCYKEGDLGENQCFTKCDPLPDVWTGLWRSGCDYPLADGCEPENTLTGQISWMGTTRALQVPAEYGSLPFWRDTSVASALPGQVVTMPGGTLGYEWDFEQYEAFYPPQRIKMSKTLADGETHQLSLYRHASGAYVFGAGTVQWSWGLDANHDRSGGAENLDMQQATANLFLDMGVTPETPQAGLVLNTLPVDAVAPVSVITSPPDASNVESGSAITITGTASDTGGGTLVLVEVSVDGGSTWQTADGLANWTYAWTPGALGSATILSRAMDSSFNLETPGAGVTVTVDPRVCPCSLWTDATLPGTAASTDVRPVEVGMKVQTDLDGYVTSVRFYKGATNTGTHEGHLWASDGTLLASTTFTGETATGWQEQAFNPPVPVTANTTYVISYWAPNGHYAVDAGFFSPSGVDNTPLRALADNEDGPNGVYNYDAIGFPTTTWQSANYWVDLVFNETADDQQAPSLTARVPLPASTDAFVSANVTATFNEPVQELTILFELRDPLSALVPGTVSYDAPTQTVTFDPTSDLVQGDTYTASVSGAQDLSGNVMTLDSWSFTIDGVAPPDPSEGPGGPILVIGDPANLFGRYHAEILRAEGFTAFAVENIGDVDATLLTGYDVVILGEMPLNTAQVTMFTDWVIAGGDLIAMRPDPALADLLGLTPAAGTLDDAYLLIDTASGPGVGLVAETIQYHGSADLLDLSPEDDAVALATLYSDVSTATANPAVTLNSVGVSGGQAAAFAYDLARSVVYTRQGNPAWVGQERDGTSPIRSNDLFYPDYINLDKVAIPQADEQQRLLANLILQMNQDKMPLPRLWYFPSGHKAVIVMTGDHHGCCAASGSRFDRYITQSPVDCSLEDWECVRASTYVYANGDWTDAEALAYHNLGFEIGAHVNTGCGNFTESQLDGLYSSQLGTLDSLFPSLPRQDSERTHCIAWADWVYQPKVKANYGIRLDTNYYYWPGSWIQNRPGMFTGSGMPMRFADLDGTMIDVYQVVTQMTDESGQTYPYTSDTLLDRALGPEGYYGAFCANMHTDQAIHAGSDAIVASAQARGVPVVSGRQMQVWLDARNTSTFTNMAYASDVLSFTLTAAASARNLEVMLPAQLGAITLTAITHDAVGVSYRTETIKGVEYAIFEGLSGDYTASYLLDSTPPAISLLTAMPHSDGTADVTWSTDEAADSQVDYGTDPGILNLSVTSAALTTSHSLQLTGLADDTIYYYRASSADAAANSATEPDPPTAPLSFTTPAPGCFTDDVVADFEAGTTGADTEVSGDGGGAVTLASAVGASFSGTTLPAGWDSYLWNPAGTATVSAGQITVDAARANPEPIGPSDWGPGQVLEFVATFQGDRLQHVGFGGGTHSGTPLLFNSDPWVLISTGSSGGGLQARSFGATQTDTPIAGSFLGAPHLYRIEWDATEIRFFIDDLPVATHAVSIAGPMRPGISDFDVGGGALQVDWIRMTPFSLAGSFESRVYDALGPANWGAVTWTSTEPVGTTLSIFARTGDTAIPDGSWSSYAQILSSGATLGGNSRYVQYRADLATGDALVTPVLEEITISCNVGPDVIPPMISNLIATPDVSGTSATITWDTDEAADSRVDYGTDSGSLLLNESAAGLVTSHSLVLTSLTPGTIYYYRATSADAAANPTTEPPTAGAPASFSTPLPPAPPCVEDDSLADFAAGDTGADTYLSETDDGEVILKPTEAAEFDGVALPAGWTSTAWGGGGSSTVGSGVLTVDQARVQTSATYGAGRSLEFVATFDAEVNQHIGFSDDFASTWIIFSTYTTTTTMHTRVNPGGSNIAIPGSYIGTEHRYRIDWNVNDIKFYIDDVLVDTQTVAIGASLAPIASDFVAGPTLEVDWMRMTPYGASGSYESAVTDAGAASDWQAVTWTSDEPTGTSVSVNVRTGDTAVPDGSWSAYIPIAFSGDSVGANARYIQYRIDLASGDAALTPALEDITIACQVGVDTDPPIITNLTAVPGPSGTTATVTWDTDEPADSWVDYGLDSGTLTLNETDATLVMAHSLQLTGLTPGTTYHYRATSADASLNSANEPVPPATFTFTTPYPACASDATTADFALGSFDPGQIYISENNDGEVSLAPAEGIEFSGTALPTGWSHYPWDAGGAGTATVSGGLVTIDGTRVNNTPTSYGSGRSLEFLATFSTTAFQHIGFGGGLEGNPTGTQSGEIYNSAPWAMFSTGSSGAAIQARVWNGGGFLDTTIPGSYLGAAHLYRIDWNATDIQFFIDGALVHTEVVVITAGDGTMRPAASDFNLGGGVLTVDWMRMTPYTTPGSFESQIFDGGGLVLWDEVTWVEDLPAGTGLTVSARVGNTPAPDGSWSSYTPVLSSGSSLGLVGQYLQYEATLSTTDPTLTPLLEELSVTCGAAPVLNTVTLVPAPTCLSSAYACNTVSAQIDRGEATGIGAFVVTVQLSPELVLCTATPSVDIREGTYLNAVGTTSFNVVDEGGGSYRVEGTIIGGGCGATDPTGTLFEMDVAAAVNDGLGTLAVSTVTLSDCATGPIGVAAGPDAEITIDNSAPLAVEDLQALPQLSGNDTDGTIKITLNWSDALPNSVEVFRKGFGAYPEYDDDSGFEPTAPSSPSTAMGAGWTSLGILSPGAIDEPATRDVWYYVAFVSDPCGNLSAVSNRTPGTLNYHLADVSDGVTPGVGNNQVSTEDISLLGAHYFTGDGDALYLPVLDIGPTHDLSPTGRPTTDDLIGFEDLILFGLTYEDVSKILKDPPVVAQRNEVFAYVPEIPAEGNFQVTLWMTGDGRIQGLRVPLRWDASVVQPTGFTKGDLLDAQGGSSVILEAQRGTVDATLLGVGEWGISGEGVLAMVEFRVLRAGEPAIELEQITARDESNREVEVGAQVTGENPLPSLLPRVTQLHAPVPNPFNPQTTVAFDLARSGPVRVNIYSVSGRLVRTLISGEFPAGNHKQIWNGTDDAGDTVASGAYFVRLEAAGVSQVQKALLLK